MYTRSRKLRLILGSVIRTCKQSNISLSPVYIESISNALADALSRTIESRATVLTDSWFARVSKLLNYQILDFNSFRPDAPIPRTRQPLLALPPWHAIPHLLLKLAARKPPSAAIVPFWPAQPWWSLLHRLPQPLYMYRLPQPFLSKHWDGLLIICGVSLSAL